MSDEQTITIESDLSEEQYHQLIAAEFEGVLEEHEGATMNAIYNHDHYGLISLTVAFAPSDPETDMVVSYGQWEHEEHPATGDMTLQRREDGDD